MQYAVRLASSASITIATACYLWSYETENTCHAPASQKEWGMKDHEHTDVALQFRQILKIWWTFALIDAIRCALALGAVVWKSQVLSYFYYLLHINNLLGLAALIILHVYRFRYPGRYCSGDYLEV
jgi:hypothetical protein